MLNKSQLSYQGGWANYKGVKVGYVSKKIAHLFFENCVGAKANNDTQWFQLILSALPLLT
jgi:hypothetical protein